MLKKEIFNDIIDRYDYRLMNVFRYLLIINIHILNTLKFD